MQRGYNFFMSAQTPNGFITYSDEILDKSQKAYLLKGGAGSGKSTFIKMAVSKIKTKAPVELICCSSDPASLDGAIINNGEIAFLDATKPHSVEPRLPGVTEKVISLYDFFDEKKLNQRKDELLKYKNTELLLSKQAENFIRAAGMLLYSNESLMSRCVDSDKLSNYITRLCIRELKPLKNKVGKINNRFLSTLTGEGIFMFTDTISKLCDRVIVIDDDTPCVSALILEAVEKTAVSLGYEVYSCACPLSFKGRKEHLLIPEISLAFTTSNKFHSYTGEYYKKIRAERFIDKERLRESNFKVKYRTKAARELLKEAAKYNKERLVNHLRLEKCYNDCVLAQKREEYVKEQLLKIV